MDTNQIKLIVSFIEALNHGTRTAGVEQTHPDIGRYVLIRSESSGVHCGMLVSKNSNEVRLSGSRRIWSWRGANSCSGIAVTGVGVGSKVAPVVAEITVLGVIEIIPMTDAARTSIEDASWE